MSVRDPYNINPILLAFEINEMMPEVIEELDKISTDEDKLIYAEKKLSEHFTNNDITKVLAFIDCYQGTTGEDAKDLITRYLADFGLPDFLSETKEDLKEELMGIIDLYFPDLNN
ncbi:MAG TPA: hypothetical protein LFV66_04425 [Rickettsia endosymbiont of Bembidion lapponicum]|nr:hypothetical protein [Rickettsia endosymbiont of Bembidion lapponicum]